MSRESVPCVTRTFMCDSLRRSSSWLEMGSLVTNFRICPCRNLLCTFSAMVGLTLCTHLHNYARCFGPLSILFYRFPDICPVRIECAGLTRDTARRKILAPEHSDAREKIFSEIRFCDSALHRRGLQRLQVQGIRRALGWRCECARFRRFEVCRTSARPANRAETRSVDERRRGTLPESNARCSRTRE